MFVSLFLLFNLRTEPSCLPGTRIARENYSIATEIILIVEQTFVNGPDVEKFFSMIFDVHSGLLKKNVGQNSTCPNHVSLVEFGIPSNSARNSVKKTGLMIQALDNATSVKLQNWQSGRHRADAYQAIWFALDNVLLRPSSTSACKRSRHIILIADEDRKIGYTFRTFTRQMLIHRLSKEHVKLHALIDSRFTVPDVQDVIGRSDSVGYSQSHTEDSCAEIHPNVKHTGAFGQTHGDFIELAIALNGTAWDRYHLNSEPRRKAMACMLATLTVSGLKHPGEYCTRCTCDVNGNEQCSTESSSKPGQCFCEHAREMVSETQCAVYCKMVNFRLEYNHLKYSLFTRTLWCAELYQQ